MQSLSHPARHMAKTTSIETPASALALADSEPQGFTTDRKGKGKQRAVEPETPPLQNASKRSPPAHLHAVAGA